MKLAFKKLSYVIVVAFLSLIFSNVNAQTGTIKGTVKSGTELLDGASVVIEGQNAGNRTNPNGVFELKLKPGNYSLVVSFVGYKPKTIQANVKEGQITTVDVSLVAVEDLGKVTVLGSRSSALRSKTETPAPVDVFNAKELVSTGQVEPTQMLNFVAPSFNSSRQTIADGTDHIDPATLRGLGPDQVLMLLNGRRRHNTALLNVNGTIGRGSVGTDMNSIPTSMIEKIEVLRDGASSQYGSDAISGVINVGLKKNAGFSFNGQLGQMYAGDGKTAQGAISQGFRFGKNKKAFLVVGGDYRFRGSTNRVGDYTAGVYYNYPAVGNPTRDSIIRLDNALISQRGFSRSKNLLLGNSQVENITGMINAGMPLTKKINLTFNAGFGKREGDAAGFYRYARQTSQVISALYPDGFLPHILSNINDKNFTVGLDGKLGQWDWDLSNTYGSNGFDFNVANSNNASQFALGSAAQTKFDAGGLRFNQNTANLNLSRDFGKQMNLKSFNLGAGLEYRREGYQIIEGEEASWKNYDPTSGRVGGAQVFPGFQPSNAVNAKRNVMGVYVDVETDISDKLLINIAGRYEDYSDFGGNFAAKFAARYKITDNISVRGAFSNGFRAPSMHQRYFSSVSTVFTSVGGQILPFQQGNFNNQSDVAKAFGIPSLGAETSTNFSAGLTGKFLKNKLTATVDLYNINIKNRVTFSSAFRKTGGPESATVTALLGAFPSLNDVTSAAFFSNAIDTKTSGIDIVTSFSDRLGKGAFTFTAAANFNKTKVDKVNAVGKVNDAVMQSRLFSREDQARLELGQPSDKQTFNVNYRIDKWSFNTRASRFGWVGTKDPANPALDENFAPKWVTDMQLGYKILPWATWSIGANNIMDIYPDKLVNFANTSDNRFIYSRGATQFGFNGGYYYTNLNVDLNENTLAKKIKAAKALKPLPPAPMVVETTKPTTIVDADMDGVADADDACPSVKGSIAMKGCPDGDGDGIADKDDDCATAAGSRILKGCPDGDGDGIADKNDKCPNQAGPARNNGCPIGDSDNDGLNDEADSCPKEAGPASNGGCPERAAEKEEVKEEEVMQEAQKQVSKAAGSIYFETGSAKLLMNNSTKAALNSVATVLNENPNALLSINGHTDNTGNENANKILSSNRAKAVLNALAAKGINKSRMSANGFGSSKPVTSNSSAAGRAKNRRVELKLSY